MEPAVDELSQLKAEHKVLCEQLMKMKLEKDQLKKSALELESTVKTIQELNENMSTNLKKLLDPSARERKAELEMKNIHLRNRNITLAVNIHTKKARIDALSAKIITLEKALLEMSLSTEQQDQESCAYSKKIVELQGKLSNMKIMFDEAESKVACLEDEVDFNSAKLAVSHSNNECKKLESEELRNLLEIAEKQRSILIQQAKLGGPDDAKSLPFAKIIDHRVDLGNLIDLIKERFIPFEEEHCHCSEKFYNQNVLYQANIFRYARQVNLSFETWEAYAAVLKKDVTNMAFQRHTAFIRSNFVERQYLAEKYEYMRRLINHMRDKLEEKETLMHSEKMKLVSAAELYWSTTKELTKWRIEAARLKNKLLVQNQNIFAKADDSPTPRTLDEVFVEDYPSDEVASGYYKP